MRRGSCEHPVQEPFRAHCLASVETLAVEPEAMALRILGAEIIAGRRILPPPPFGGDASGPSMAAISCRMRRHLKRSGGPSGISAIASINSGRSNRRSGRVGGGAFSACARARAVGFATLGRRALASRNGGDGEFGNMRVESCGRVTRRGAEPRAQAVERSARLRSRSPSWAVRVPFARGQRFCDKAGEAHDVDAVAGVESRLRQARRGARETTARSFGIVERPAGAQHRCGASRRRRGTDGLRTAGRRIARITGDGLRRSSLYLMLSQGVNAAADSYFGSSVHGFYSPNVVGLAAAFISLGSLIGAFTTLGLPNTVLRFLPTTDLKGRLVSQALLIVGLFSLVVGWGAGLLLHIFIPRLPDSGESGFYAWTIVSLVVFLTLLTLLDNVCLAYRRADFVLYRQLITTIPRLAMPFLLTGLALRGLLLAFVITLALGVIYDAIIVYRRLLIGQSIIPSGTTLWTYRRYSGSNFLGGMFGILPSSLLPLIVLHDLGADNAAYFYMPFQIATLLNLVCSSTAAALLSEASQTENIEHQRQLLKAAARD